MTLGFSDGGRHGVPAGAPLEAFEGWAGLIRPRLVSLARRFLWNVQDAEEVAQEALLIAWRNQGKLAEPGMRNAWVYRTAINLCLSRRRRRRPEPLPLIEPQGRAEAVGGLETAELMERVRAAILEMPARQQAAMVLRDMEGLAYAEIAGIMQTTAASARLLVHRGREAVRELILRRWPDSFKV
jgi:RNA polymerase sigma-70 factor, ECF subfamily